MTSYYTGGTKSHNRANTMRKWKKLRNTIHAHMSIRHTHSHTHVMCIISALKDSIIMYFCDDFHFVAFCPQSLSHSFKVKSSNFCDDDDDDDIDGIDNNGKNSTIPTAYVQHILRTAATAAQACENLTRKMSAAFMYICVCAVSKQQREYVCEYVCVRVFAVSVSRSW